jgi:hypothetical protein
LKELIRVLKMLKFLWENPYCHDELCCN